MNTRTVTAFGMVLLAAPFMNGHAFADASYQSTTEITGGTLVDSMKSIPFFSRSMKNAFAPTTTLTMVHGNQKATVSKESTDIIDLDKEEMIHIDLVKKTYSVVTFAQMRQAMENMPQQIQAAQAQVHQAQAQQPKPNLKMSFDVKVNNTGASKVVNGLMAQEQIVTLTMTLTDPDAAATSTNGAAPAQGPAQPASVAYTVTTDAWIAPDPPEVAEIQDFDVRMGKKMMEGVDVQAFVAQMRASGNAMAQMLGGKPGASDAMAQMGKEMAKLKGTRVLEVTSMGGMAPTQGTGTAPATAPAAPPPSSGSVAGQVAGDTATQTAANESGRLGGFGSALGGSVMSAWHKKKASTPPPAPAPAATSTSAPPAAGQTQTVVMMSMTTQKSNFSQDTVPSSAFDVPAGYTQVASPYERMSQNQ